MAKRIHFMGIGGAGVSAVAAFAKNAGFEISGCDLDQGSAFLKPLVNDQVELYFQHDASHLEGVDTLVVSPAIESLDSNNSELLAARQRNISVVIGEKFLAEHILPNKKVIAISGTHGKSTTTAMVGKILEAAGLDPSVLVGAIVTDWGKNYKIGGSEYFVIEADEYQDKFLLYKPFLSVITAIEMDHPEFFPDETAVRLSFEKFVENTSEHLILGGKTQIKINNSKLKISKLGSDFQVQKFHLKLLGDFNQTNAAIAFEVTKLLGVSEELAKTALEDFSGVGRRLEFKGEARKIKVFDDYGHHPTAIATIAQAARQKFPDSKIWLVYQPHMFSRTKYLEKEFVDVFKNIPVNEIILVDIFAARQENNEKISSRDIVEQVKSENVRYIADFESVSNFLTDNLREGNVVINMGAGDIYKLSGLLLKKLENK